MPLFRKILVLLSLFFHETYSSQIINAYAKVTSIVGSTTLKLSATYTAPGNTFVAGQKIIVIQMQGATISSSSNNSTFGNLASLNSCGLYEVATISAVDAAINNMTITSALANAYSTTSGLQIVSYPKLGTSSYSTVADISGLNWDGNIGGVIAFFVNGNLNLRHNISANGIGFRGGDKAGQDGGACDNTTFRTSAGDPRFPSKGEGVYITTSGQKAGLGKAVNGGGAGNVHNGGGGGGANYSFGGKGYDGWGGAGCSPVLSSGGFGGIAISSSASRIFMGGGGGGGQENNNQATDGAYGGGIILIKCDTIVISGACTPRSITADGNKSLDSGQDGSGGGGAGGSIVLNIKGFRVKSGCNLTTSADGGDGGDVLHFDVHGSGGGGGQGAIYLNTSATLTNVTLSTNFGIGGLVSNTTTVRANSGGGPANAGIFTGSFISPLPIELLKFEAQEINQEFIQLDWETASELNNKNFEIYHSKNANDWVLIGDLSGAGHSNTIRKYVFKDLKPSLGVNYYKLKQIDFDGSNKFSPIAYAEYTKPEPTIQLYPNPSEGYIYLESEEDLTSENFSLFNAFGKKLSINISQIETNKFKIDLIDLPKGIYIIISKNCSQKILLR